MDECGKSRTAIEVVEVAPIEDKLIENKLRWFGHVQRKKSDVIMINENVRSTRRLDMGCCNKYLEKNTNLFNLIENIASTKQNNKK